MGKLIRDLREVTPVWLTEVLRHAGVLPYGEVSDVQIEHDIAPAGATSISSALQLLYTPDAPDSVPRDLFLKFGTRKPEVDFYCHIAPELGQSVPLVRCYDAVFQDGASHLLFDNMSLTHTGPPDDLGPTVSMLRQMIATVARVHAHFWEDPRLVGEWLSYLDDPPSFLLEQSRDHWNAFVEQVGDRVSRHSRDLLKSILDHLPLPVWQARMDTHHHVTLIHFDTHSHNFLYPVSPDNPLILADWAVWHRNLGPTDIAYMIAMGDYPSRRAEIEAPLVRFYHQQLLANGVQDYSWTQCWDDYRVGLINLLTLPVFWQTFLPPNIWYHSLETALMAFEDLDCASLL